jgi:hypothetical protein
VFPSIFARKGLTGRERVSEAFKDHFRNQKHEEGSALVKNRWKAAADNGDSVEDTAHFEVGGAIALLVNTTPAAFWMILLLYSTPGLLEVSSRKVFFYLLQPISGVYSRDISTP